MKRQINSRIFGIFATQSLFVILAVAAAPAPPASAASLTITDSNYGNGVFSGTYTGTNSQAAITIATAKPVTITNATVIGPGHLIYSYYSWNSNIIINNVVGIGTNPNVAGQQKGRFVQLNGPIRVTIEHCLLENTGGIYFDDYKGNSDGTQTLKIRYNYAHNIDGRKSNGSNGYRNGNTDNDFFRAQFVQLNHIGNNGAVPGIEIAWNQVINDPYVSRVEDNINIGGASSGTSGSPMQIHDNLIRGAFPALPGAQYQQTFSGGGIMLSDGGNAGAFWVQAHDNVIVGTTNYGIQINHGSNCAFWNNRVVASGLLPSSEKIWGMNVGAVLDQGSSNIAHQPGNINVGNVVGWVKPAGTQTNGGSGGVRNDSYFPENPDDYNHQSWWQPNDGSHPTLADENNEVQGWINRDASQGLNAGPTTIPDGTYAILAKTTGDALDCYGYGTTNGTIIQLWPYGGSPNQQWKIHNLGNGYYSIRTYDTAFPGGVGRSLDANGCSGADGTIIQLWDSNGGTCQQWAITPTSANNYKISTATAKGDGSHDVLDGAGCSGADGTHLLLWNWGGGSCQQEWRLQLVGAY